MISSIKKSEGKNKRPDPLRSKQNNWILDCTNITKSKVDVYNCLKDKYLKFILPCPCKKNESVLLFQHQKDLQLDNVTFKQFLQNKKKMILKQKFLFEELKCQKDNLSSKIRNKQNGLTEHKKFRKKVHKKFKNNNKINNCEKFASIV